MDPRHQEVTWKRKEENNRTGKGGPSVAIGLANYFMHKDLLHTLWGLSYTNVYMYEFSPFGVYSLVCDHLWLSSFMTT